MQRRMSWMTALDTQIFWRLMLESNLDQLLRLLRVLTEVSAETTLSLLNLSHHVEPFPMPIVANRTPR
jgi:hypothetical protein